MSSSAELAVLLTAQDRGATGTVERFRSTLGGIPNVAGGITSAIGKVGSAFATFGLATQGVQTLAGAVTSFFGDALEAQQVAAQTAQTLSTMGSASGQTAESIADMAGKLSRLSLFQDDAIQGAENLLLTFGNVGKDAFPRATQAILDLSQAMGQDLNTSATQIGKALNDPIAGVSALSRVGIQFSEDQKNMIASLMETGDVAGAQNIILGELERQFGGSAKAASDAAGPLGQVGKRFGEIKEAAGTALLPLIQFVAGGLVPVFEWLEEKIPVAIAKLISIFGGPFKAIWVTVRDAVLTFVQALQGNWTDDAKIRPIHRIMGQIATVIREQVIPAVKTIAAFFQERLVPIIQSFATTFNRVFAALADGNWLGALDGIVDGVRERFGMMGDIAKDLGSAFLDWIAPLIPPLLEKLGELASAVAGWVVDEGLPRLLEQLSAWGSAFVAWIEPLIPPMLEKLQELLGIIGAWIVDTGLPLLLEKLGEWGAAFVEWVTPYIDLALEKLGELLNRVRDWILGEGLDTLTASIEQWAAAFVDWVTPQIDLLIEKAEELAKQLGEWITGEGLTTLTAKLAEWAKAAIEWVVPVWVELELKMLELLGKLGEWIVMTALPAIVTQLAQWTYEFHRWVLEDAAPALIADLGALWSDHISPWITGTALPAIQTALKGWASAFLDWLKDSVVPFIVTKLEALLSSMKTWMTDTALPAIKEKLEDWGEAFLGFVAKDVLPFIAEKLAAILASITEWVTNTVGSVVSEGARIGVAILSGIASGIRDNAASIVGAAISYVTSLLPGWVKQGLGISSPSKVMIPIGEQVDEGLAVGIINGWETHIRPALETVTGSIAASVAASVAGSVAGSAAGIVADASYRPATTEPKITYGPSGTTVIVGKDIMHFDGKLLDFGTSGTSVISGPMPPGWSPSPGPSMLQGAPADQSAPIAQATSTSRYLPSAYRTTLMADGRKACIPTGENELTSQLKKLLKLMGNGSPWRRIEQHFHVEDRSPSAIAHATEMAGIRLATALELQGVRC